MTPTKVHLLIAEDDPYDAERLQKIVEHEGFTVWKIVKTAQDTISASIQLAQIHPGRGLVLLDVELQTAEGRSDATAGIDAAKQITEVPVIFVTHHDNQSLLTKLNTVWHYGVLNKNALLRSFRGDLPWLKHWFLHSVEIFPHHHSIRAEEIRSGSFGAHDIRNYLANIEHAERLITETRKKIESTAWKILRPNEETFKEIDPIALLNNARKSLDDQVGERAIVKTEINLRDGYRIEGDAVQLERMIANAVRNAGRHAFGNRPGRDEDNRWQNRIIVSLSFAQSAVVWDQQEHKAEMGFIRVAIQDTGFGIKPEVVQKIRRGERASAAPENDNNSLGLLSIKENMQKHRGRWAIEANAIGTLVSLYFPVIADEGGSRKRDAVLLVEDDSGLAETFKTVLESHNFDCIPASTCSAAAEHLSSGRPFSFAVVDEHLPDGSGSALVQEYMKKVSGTRFIMCSGSLHGGPYEPGHRALAHYPPGVWGCGKTAFTEFAGFLVELCKVGSNK